MPTSAHLNWLDIPTQAGQMRGLWEGSLVQKTTKQAFETPPDAFAVLNDYQPMKGGGLRAAWSPQANPSSLHMGTTGIVSIANEACMGVYANTVQTRSAPSGGGATGGVDSFDALLVTVNQSDNKLRIYRWDQSNGETQWKLVGTSGAGSASSSPASFEHFLDSNGQAYYLVACSGGDAGLYSVTYSHAASGGGAGDNAYLRQQVWWGPLAVSQQRVLVGSGLDYVVHASDVGLLTWSPGATINIGRERAGNILSGMSSIAPDDLLIAREDGPWVHVAGDITSGSTPIREMDITHVTGRHKQTLTRVPGGVAFINGDGRVIVTDGHTFKSISDMIGPLYANRTTGLLGQGSMAYSPNSDLLFCPQGYVYDFDAAEWYKQSAIDSQWHWNNEFEIWAASGGTNFDVYRFIVSPFQASAWRANTGVIQTVPYSDKNGRNLDIQEVQVFLKTFAASEIKVELIDENNNSVVTRYEVVDTARKDLVRFLFPCTKSDYLSCKITPRTLDGVSEAPTIERIRIGFGMNNLVGGR